MPAQRKYLDRYITSISLERIERDIAQSLGIYLSDALRIGLNVMINTRITDGDARVTPEIITEFIDIQRKDAEDFKAYIRLQDAAQQTLEKIAELRKEAQKPKEMVRVWDTVHERYIHIPSDRVDPLTHIISPKAPVEESGEVDG